MSKPEKLVTNEEHITSWRGEREKSTLPITGLAIGAGGLHRGLPLYYIDQLNQNGWYNGGIFVGQPLHTETAMAYNDVADGYPLVTFNSAGIRHIDYVQSVVGATSLATQEGRELFFSHTKLPLDWILVGVTEKGVAQDQIGMQLLYETLKRYREYHGQTSSIAVIDTDNVAHNGDTICRLMLEEASGRAESFLIPWLERNVGFLNTQVDRIVPKVETAVPEEFRDNARMLTGALRGSSLDRLTTFAEPMPQTWAFLISDPNRMLRVPFHCFPSPQVMVTTEDIDSQHAWKLRLANALHVPALTAAIALAFGERARIDLALQQEPVLRRYAEEFATAVAATVATDTPIPDMDPKEYSLSFLDRARAIPDDASRINVNLGTKLYERFGPTVFSTGYPLLAEAQKDRLALANAIVLKYLTALAGGYRGRDDQGREYAIPTSDWHITDMLRGVVDRRDPRQAREAVQHFCESEAVWRPKGEGRLLAENRNHTHLVSFYYNLLLVRNLAVLDILRRIL